MNTKLTYLYLYLLSIAACLTCSCTSDDPSDVLDAAKADEMILAVGELSRSSMTTDDNFRSYPFAIYGDMKFKTHDRSVIFDHTPVTYSNDGWGYGATQYWFPQHEYSFVAFHPAVTGAPATEYSDSRLSFKYTIPDNFASTLDLMVATHRRFYEEQNLSSKTTPVTLNFWHILSRVNFMIENAGAADRMRVKKIVLEGVNRTGTFAITPAALSADSRQTDDYNYSWSGISNQGTITANVDVDILENKQQPLFPDDNALFMIPQPDNKDVRVKITYTLYDSGSQPEELTLTAEAPIGGWEPGKFYTYATAISEITKEIYLTVSVKPWHPEKNAGITVPES
ncbi:MAG: fimbrillin family protein [Muribaculaceae bacterium]|nr:fimbrillin family protein [Muribaculaceae bacterium]